MIEIPQLVEAKSPAILFSGGKDSLLLLDAVRRIQPNCTIIHFYDRLRPEVEAIIKEWDLEVLSWRPSAWYLIPWRRLIGRRIVYEKDTIVLVNEYAFGEARLPVLFDVTEDENCDWERRPSKLTESFDNPFDTIIWGMKKCDELHPVMPKHFEREIQLGTSRLVAPLYDWSNEAVVKEIAELPEPVVVDVVRMCSKCREGLANWNREESLEFFARRFHYSTRSRQAA